MWIAKQPLRFDFCGCPPCPLCFDWTDGDHSPRIEGMVKFVRDLLGDKKPTKKQQTDLEKAADAIHVANKAPKTEPPVDVEAGAAAFDEADEAQFLQRRVNAAARERAKDQARPKKAALPVLDHIDMEKKPAKKKKEEKKQEVRQEVVMNDYYVDMQQREMKRQMYELQKQVERERYERERAMWKYGPSYASNPYWK